VIEGLGIAPHLSLEEAEVRLAAAKEEHGMHHVSESDGMHHVSLRDLVNALKNFSFPALRRNASQNQLISLVPPIPTRTKIHTL
jgi:hypothetical protein